MLIKQRDEHESEWLRYEVNRKILLIERKLRKETLEVRWVLSSLRMFNLPSRKTGQGNEKE